MIYPNDAFRFNFTFLRVEMSCFSKAYCEKPYTSHLLLFFAKECYELDDLLLQNYVLVNVYLVH